MRSLVPLAHGKFATAKRRVAPRPLTTSCNAQFLNRRVVFLTQSSDTLMAVHQRSKVSFVTVASSNPCIAAHYGKSFFIHVLHNVLCIFLVVLWAYLRTSVLLASRICFRSASVQKCLKHQSQLTNQPLKKILRFSLLKMFMCKQLQFAYKMPVVRPFRCVDILDVPTNTMNILLKFRRLPIRPFFVFAWMALF